VTVHQFINSQKAAWKELEAFIAQCNRVSLARVPMPEFSRGSLLYRQAIADLGYARMRFPDHPVVRELDRLLAQAHSAIYQARRGKARNWWRFWIETWPALIRQESSHIVTATAIFWAMAVLGFCMASFFPQLESLFISDAMRQSMAKGQLWTQAITGIAPQASSTIAQNNISVALLTWALGITSGIGTLWLMIFNGLMLGIIAAACFRAGLIGPLAEFVIAHGSLELPAIWIAGGAGLMLGRAMLLPGRYTRSIEIKLAAIRSVQIVVGTVPMLLIAAAVEGFVSPSPLPGIWKALLGAVLATLYLLYILTGVKRLAPHLQKNPETLK
jgi:uncharacterized membrane protein SpoIIM required for sporulation